MISLIMKDEKVLQDFYAYFSALKTSKIKAKQQANKWVKILFKKEFRLLRKYKFKLNLNKYKFEEKLLFRLSQFIKKYYDGKNIEFNIVNLKTIAYNTDIFTEMLTLKLRKEKSDPLRRINALLSKVVLPKANTIKERAILEKHVKFDTFENKYRDHLNIMKLIKKKK